MGKRGRGALDLRKAERNAEKAFIRQVALQLGIPLNARGPVHLLQAIQEAGHPLPATRYWKPTGMISNPDIITIPTGYGFNKKPRVKKVSKPVEPSMGSCLGSFYDTWEWKQLSYRIRKERGQRCECCGADPKIHAGVRIVADHIKPIRFHFELRLDPKNIQVLCDDCNKGKSYHDETDWRTT